MPTTLSTVSLCRALATRAKGLLIAAAVMCGAATAQAQVISPAPVAQSVPYFQNFGAVNFNTPPVGWAILNGLNGDSISTQALAAASVPNAAPTTVTATALGTTGGVYSDAVSGNAKLAIQQSGNTTNGVNQPMLALNTTGASNLVLRYDLVNARAETRTLGIITQYRVTNSGVWTTLPSFAGNPYTQINGTVGTVTPVRVGLPAACNNQALVQIRWANWRGTPGNSSAAAIDNVSVNANRDYVGTTANINGSLGTSEYGPLNAYSYTGGGSGFGDLLGSGSIAMSSDGTGLSIGFTPGPGTSLTGNNTAVVFLNTRTGGVSSPTALTVDIFSADRRSIARLLNSASLPAGFDADFAVAFTSSNIFLFEITPPGLNDLSAGTTRFYSSGFPEIRIPLATLGLSAASNVDFFAGLTNGEPSTFMANESIPGMAALNAGGNPGTSGGALSAFARFQIYSAPPAITTQPVDAAICAGQTATFTVAATSVESPITYQWQESSSVGGPFVNVLASGNTTTFSFGSLNPSSVSTRYYRCIISSVAGSTTSSPALMTVNALPASLPGGTASYTGFVGVPQTLTLAPTGANTVIDWYPTNASTVPFATGVNSVSYTPPSAGNNFVFAGERNATTGCNATIRRQVTINASVAVPTSIGTQPTGSTVCNGSPLALTVVASGTSLTYQWKLDGNDIQGATNATYSVASAAAANAGSYTVVVTGTNGTVTSSAAIVTVNALTAIGTQPVGSTLCAGSPLSLSVIASGAGLTYQWQLNGSPIGGATASTYSVGAATAANAGSYTVIVTGNCGAVTSHAVSVIVNPATAISMQPSGSTVCVNSALSLSVVAIGDALTYQWQLDGSDVVDATASTYSVASATSANAGSYTVIVTGTCGSPVTSSAAAVSVLTPALATYVDDDYASLANGTVVTFPLTGGTGIHIIGCDAFATVQAGIDAVDASGTVNVAAGTYLERPTISKSITLLGANAGIDACTGTRLAETIVIPDSGTATLAGTTGFVSVTAPNVTINGFTFDGDNPALTSPFTANGANPDVDTGIATEGATAGDNLVITNNVIKNIFQFGVALGSTGGPAMSGRVDHNRLDNIPYWAGVLAYDDYYAVIDNNCINNAWRGVQTNNFYQANPSATPASISNNTITTQTQVIAGDATYTDVAGILVNLHYTGASAWQVSGNTISNATPREAGSDGIILWSIQTATVVGLSSNDITGFESGYELWNCPTSSTITITGGTVTDCGTGVTATNFSSFGDAGSSKYILSGLTVTGSTGAAVSVIDSALNTNGSTVGVTIQSASSFTGNATGVDVSGPDAAAMVKASILTGNTVTALSVTGGGKLDAGDCTNSNLTGLGTSTGGNTLTGYGFDSAAPFAVSNSNLAAEPAVFATGNNYGNTPIQAIAALLSGNGGANSAINTNSSSGPGITTQPIGGAVCSPATLLLTSAAVNASSVQWRLDGNPIMGATSPSYTATLSGSYDAVYTDFCGATSTTDAAAVIVNTPVAIVTDPSSSTICEGSGASFSVTATGTGLSYQWNKNGSPISGETNATYSLPAASVGDSGSYTVTVAGTCGTLTSGPAILTVNPNTIIVTGPAPSTVCEGAAAGFSVSATGAGLSYQWFKDAVLIPGAISSSYPIAAASAADAGSYTVTVSGTCGTLTSPAATLTVNSNTAITTQPLSSNLCEGLSANFTVVATGTGLSYQWKKNGNDIGGATTATYSIAAVTSADAGSYTVTVTGTCGTLTSSAAALVVNTPPVITTQPASVAACLGSPASFTVVATGTGLSYQWQLNGTDIPSETNATYSIPSVSALAAGSYTVVITGACGIPVTSSLAVLTVGGSTAVVFVDDNYFGLPIGTAVNFPATGLPGPYTIGCNAFATIQEGVTKVDPSGTVNVAAGSYIEDVSIPKSLSMLGNSAATVTVSGAIGGAGTTLAVNASNITIKGFTITREGNNPADWNGLNGALNSAGVAVQGTSITGLLLADCVITGNRSGIDLNNTGGHTIRNNIITNNRTGMVLRNQTDALTISENEITDNWTVGILFLDGSGGSNSPPQQAAGSTFSNNNLSGNWYGQIVDRQTGGSIPTPGTNIKNFSANWLGTASPVISALNSTEPGYAAQIPVIFGGTAVPPGGQPDVLGPASANFDITPLLSTGADTNLSGSGDTFGFQGDFSSLTVTAQLAQTGASGRIQEGHDLVTTAGTVSVSAGSFTENIAITKPLHIIGAGSGDCDSAANPATQSIVTSVLSDTAVISINDVGGLSAGNRLSISGLRITGAAGNADLAAGIMLTASSGNTRAHYTFSGLTITSNAGSGIGFAGSNGAFTDIHVSSSNLCSNYRGTSNASNLAGLSGMSISGSTIKNNVFHGISFFGSTAAPTWTPTDISISSSSLSNNGQSNNFFQGSGDISFFEFNGNASINIVNIATSGRVPMQFRGRGGASPATWLPSGQIVLTDLTVTGTADRSAIIIQNYSDVSGILLYNVDLSNVTNLNLPNTAFSVTGMTLTHSGLSPLALNNTIFPCQGPGYVGLALFGTGGATATCNTVFVGATTLAQKEACVFDVNDAPGFGDVTFPDASINIGGQPTSSIVCSGSAASFSVTATNATGYQWYQDAILIPGATSSTYAIPAANLGNAGSYTVVITGLCGDITSDAATLTVNPGTVIVTGPSSSTVCEGVATGFTVSATGTGLAYQWYLNASPISGANSPSYAIPAASTGNAGSYTVTVSGTCGTLTSSAATLTVNTAPVIGTQPSGSTVCTGDPATFTVTATGTGLAYQWNKNDNPILTATSATYSIPVTSDADSASYTVTITGTCGTVTSSPAVLTVNSATAITGQPSGSTVCAGLPASFTVTATGTGLAYQWYKDGNLISGASAATYAIPATTSGDAASYTVTITGSCGVLTSTPAVLAVNTAPALTALTTSSTVCTGSIFTLSVTATGTAPFSYQWLKDGNPIALATNNTYSIAAVGPSNAGSYSVQVTNTCGTTTSNIHILTIGSAPVISGQPAPSSTAVGGIATFSVTAAATPGPITYQWRRGGVNLPSAGVYSGVNTPTLTINPATLVVAGTFDCVVSAPCGITTSNSALLSVGTAPSITNQPNPVLARISECITFTSTATGAPTLTYQWFKDGLPLSNGGSISGATTTTLSICPVTAGDAGIYTMVATNPYGNATSNPAALTINPACNCADIVTTPGLPPGDGILDGNDFIAFINAFGADDPAADIASSEGCGPDGTIDGNDFILFINQFAEGC